MEILNQKAYYAFHNRILQFNTLYGQQMGDRGPITEEHFQKIGDAWAQISEKYATEADPTGVRSIPDNIWLSEDDFNLLLNAASEVYQDLSGIALNSNLSETHMDDDGREVTDFTYTARDILELGVLALHAYTKSMDQCKNHTNFTRGMERASQLAYRFYDEKRLPVLEVDYNSRQIREDPSRNLSWLIDFQTEKSSNTLYEQQLVRTPYHQLMKESQERRRQKEIEDEEARAERQYREELEAQKQSEAASRAAAEQEKKEEQATYESVKNAIPFVPNVENPGKVTAPFYQYYAKFAERMGIDPNVMNAQTLISAMNKAHTEGTDLQSFRLKVLPLYNQIRRLTFEAYVEKSLRENRPIDLNLATTEVDNLMGALYYTADPLGFNRNNIDTQIRAMNVTTGTLGSSGYAMGEIDRKAVLDHLKAVYREKGPEFFTAEAEARYASFATEKKSSGDIVTDAENSLAAYQQYKEDLANNVEGHSLHQQAQFKKAAFDAAYALEKRVETRYASRAARFFRFFSYRKQAKELSRMKEALGIQPGERVADNMVETRLADLFRDDSDIKVYQQAAQNNAKQNAIVQTLANINRTIGRLPKITENDVLEEQLRNQVKPEEEIIEEPQNTEIIDDSQHDMEYEVNRHEKEQQDLEEARLREEERAREEELLLEEERVRVQQEIEREERERQQERERKITAAKQMLYDQKLETLNQQLATSISAKDSLEKERLNQLDSVKERVQSLDDLIAEREAKNAELQKSIDDLSEHLTEVMQMITEKNVALMDNAEISKTVNKAAKDAKKGVGKNINKQKLQNIQKVADYIGEDMSIQPLMDAAGKIQLEIKEKSDEIEKNNQVIGDYKQDKKGYQSDIDRYSQSYPAEQEGAREIRQLREKIKDMQTRREQILQTGEGLGFDEANLDHYEMENPAPVNENAKDRPLREPFIVEELAEKVSTVKAPRVDPSMQPQRNMNKNQ